MIISNYSIIIYILLFLVTIFLGAYTIYMFIFIYEKRYRLKKNWKLEVRDGETILKDTESDKYFKLNESAAFVVKLLEKEDGLSSEMIQLQLLRTYQLTIHEVKPIVADLLPELLSNGLIEEIIIRNYYKRKAAGEASWTLTSPFHTSPLFSLHCLQVDLPNLNDDSPEDEPTEP